MKKTKKLWLALLLTVLVAALLAVGFTAAAEEPTIVAEDTCGQYGWYGNMVTFTLNSEGLLTFRGSGPIASGNPDVDGDFSYPRLSTQGPVREVVIEDGVTSVPRFCNQTYLTKATIGNSVTKISEDEELFGTFSGCSALTSVNLPDGLEFIGDRAFENCTALKNIELPAGLTEVLRGAFSGCTALQNVFYAGTQEQWNELFIYYDEYADDRNAPLLNANIYYNVVDWGYCGGEGDGTNLIWVLTNDGTLTISGEGAMADYSYDYYHAGFTDEYGYHDWLYVTRAPWWKDPFSIHAVVLEDGVTTIGNYAFCGCMALETVQIPASFTEIGTGPFTSCPAITAYTVDPENASFSSDATGVLYDKEQTKLIRYPFGREDTTFTIPDTVTVIDFGAFSTGVGGSAPAYTNYKGHLEGFIIPASVTKIEVGALAHSDELRYIKVLNPDCEMTYRAFMLQCDSERTPHRLKVYGYLGSTAEQSAHTAEEATSTIPGYGRVKDLFVALCPTDADHTVIQADAADPTCTEPGHTAGWYCEDCGVYLSGEAQPALGHSWGEWVVVKQATTDETGLMRRTCQNDPTHVEEQVIPKLQPQTSVFQQFIERVKDFFQNIANWFSRLFRW